MWWICDSQAEAEAANDACSAQLGPDVLPDGDVAPVQITERWAEVRETADGRWAIPVKPGQATPAGATEGEPEWPPEPDVI